ncbi:MAG: sigma-70 family RNA polymerase sigma factor, partial [Planctomycetota bacterium]
MPRDSSSPRSDSSPTDAPPDGAAETELESPLERDQRLLAAWRDGDADRGEALMAHYHGYFLSLCWRYGVRTEEAQLDLYQEILVRLLRVLPRLEISSSFGGYLRRVFHTAVRETKPLAPTPSLPEGAELAGATPSREVEDQEIVAAIEECSEGLADRE